MTRRRRTLTAAGVALVVVAVAVAAVIISVVAGTSRSGHRRPARPAAASRPTPAGVSETVAPSTTVPADTPTQARYDTAFAAGFSSTANRRALAAVARYPEPPAAVAGGWPELEASSDAAQWSFGFVTGLFDIDFATQTRAGLAGWLAEQSAVDLMPGIPSDVGPKMLAVSVLDPGLFPDMAATPIPDGPQWAAMAAAGIRWSVSDLQVVPDPGWEQMVEAGWQPRDLYASVQDVTGTLTVADGSQTTAEPLSVVVQLGSAVHHFGYGTVTITGQGG